MIPLRLGKKPHKYKAKPCVVDGIKFDSQAEAQRWSELRLLERAGEIRDLRHHVHLPIVIDGEKICGYEADFVYIETKWYGKTGIQRMVVEDVKGAPLTAVYRLKKKLLRVSLGIEIREIRKGRHRDP